jgi:hypothetical protein
VRSLRRSEERKVKGRKRKERRITKKSTATLTMRLQRFLQ